jgi:hypothetical protein
MFLYELAIELGISSTELVEIAARMGMGRLSGSATLTREEVDAIREAHRTDSVPNRLVAAAAAPEVPSILADMPLPVDPGPPPSLQPAAPGAAGADAPLGWGPPSGGGLPPLAGAGEPVAWGSGGEDGPHAEAFHHVAAMQAGDGPDGEAPAFAPPTHGGPTFQAPASGGGSTLPPPPPPPPGPTLDLSDSYGSSAPRFDKKQVAIVGSVVVLIIGLFAYMTINSGPDKKREAEIAAKNKKLLSEPMETFATIPPATATTEAPVATPKSTRPVDVVRFCNGARTMLAWELRGMASELDTNWEQAKADMLASRPKWEQAVADMVTYGSPERRDDVVFYRDTYHFMFDQVFTAPSQAEGRAKYGELDLTHLSQSVIRVRQEITNEC